MCKKKAIALMLLSAVGVTNSSMMTLETHADENNDELKNEKTIEENKFKALTDEEKDKLDIDIKEIQIFDEMKVESEQLEEEVEIKKNEVQEDTAKVKEEKENELSVRSSLVGKVINVSSNLRIRASSSTSSQVKGTLKNGETFNIESKENSWYKINHKGITGYVHSDYVTIVNGNNNNNSSPNNTGGQVSNNTNGQIGQVFNVSSSLRIRAEANTTSTILGYLKPNEKVNIISESNGWYKISVGSIKGYVSASYIKKISGNSTQELSKPNDNNSNNSSNNESGLILFKEYKDAKLKNVSTNLRVRSKPSTNSTVLTYLLPSDTFKVEGENGSWYYININGKKGYAHKDYVRLLESNSNSGSGSSSNNEVSKTYGALLSVMKSQIGSPYIFGGAGETITRSLLNNLKSQYPTMNYSLDSKYIDNGYKAFDCSGLMQWSFKQIGINIGRSTYSQINNGIEVSLNNIKEGDLLFYSDLNHVGMYVGNGQWLESPRSGEFVRISNVPWNKVGRVRRILK